MNELMVKESPIPLDLKKQSFGQFKNPIPVVVAIVPVIGQDLRDGETKTGVLAVRRAIPPRQGFLALPGGYLEYEDWRSAGLRELYEETSVDLRADGELELHSIQSVEGGKRLLVFGITKPIREAELPAFVPNAECSERVVLYHPTELAFPSHSEVLSRVLK